ncbi:MAG: TMEM14 family protein [Mastigocoleus sp. MO_167.B18]|uniref:TMEM14 family protein n=1 Tax=Mastigocoleus sp. MO_188.B34 TaxID=3036635 RepID=UPI00261FB4B5|nr:TMEM14 family protein [Mastigocoleus sp. MO_188.B34]MDJ0695757.1 TMEM14 family protein [Mastigocoleus sp. MO_188.B34]MDJ0773990.1 TMEM14 family protein [Mastigocoleus sp. MO_167.B18]
MTISVFSIILYGILEIIGGLIGYQKAGSKISLISGVISGLLLLLSGFVTLQGQKWGLILGFAVAGMLVIVFAVRFVKTRKFMPAGLMSILGLVVIFSILKNF